VLQKKAGAEARNHGLDGGIVVVVDQRIGTIAGEQCHGEEHGHKAGGGAKEARQPPAD
jgi:hypothetical protein